MLHYLIKQNAEQLDIDAVRVEYPVIVAHIDELAGRTIGSWALAQLRDSKDGRIFISTSLGSPGRAMYGRGFVVQRVES